MKPPSLLNKAFAAADLAFISQHRSGHLPFAQWTHRNHVRLAYMHIWESNFAFESALAEVRSDIQRYNALHAEKLTLGYHETLTHFWVCAVQSRALAHPLFSFDGFWERESAMLGNTQLWSRHFSRDVLFSSKAKAGLVDPDIAPLPRIV